MLSPTSPSISVRSNNLIALSSQPSKYHQLPLKAFSACSHAIGIATVNFYQRLPLSACTSLALLLQLPLKVVSVINTHFHNCCTYNFACTLSIRVRFYSLTARPLDIQHLDPLLTLSQLVHLQSHLHAVNPSIVLQPLTARSLDTKFRSVLRIPQLQLL